MGASRSSDGAAGSLPLDRERDSPSPGRDLCLLVSTITFLWRLTASLACSGGETIGLFNEAFGASLSGDASTSRAMGRVGGSLPLVTLGIPRSSPRSIRSAFRPTAGLPTFVIGRCPADSKIDPGGEVVTIPTLAKEKARHEQVPSRDNSGPSALAQEDDKVAPRVRCYLAGRDPPPPQAFLDEWVQRKPKIDLQSIQPGLRNMQPVFDRDAIPLPNRDK
ncbi:hypothetical protein GW17_00061291 [Ensete ventricosum]|nr:hypothetical protein GW17_00061291 [Ensete ventricosum]